jgi:hypothetical protein
MNKDKGDRERSPRHRCAHTRQPNLTKPLANKQPTFITTT